jgi:hypothetical protein
MIHDLYQLEHYVLMPRMLPTDQAGRLAHLTVALPSRRVTVESDQPSEWDELAIEPSSELHRLLLNDPARAAVLEALAVDEPGVVKCWVNRYRTGEWIAPHRDAAGTVQLLICLRAPADEMCGGILHLALPAGPLACPLGPGDAVLWEATTIEHWITRLVATNSDPEPERVVLVGRYYMDG